MSISGLVLTLSDGAAADAALATLSADPRITVGERFGRRLAVVADTASVESDRDLWDQLRGNPGITNVDVTFVHLDEPPVANDNMNRDGPVEDKHAHR